MDLVSLWGWIFGSHLWNFSLWSSEGQASFSWAPLWHLPQQTQLAPGWGRWVPAPQQQQVLSTSFCFVLLGFVLFSEASSAEASPGAATPAPRTDELWFVWNDFVVVVAQVWEICHKTISPQTVTDENFHSVYLNVKTLLGRSQAKYFSGFLFFSKS